ncbi:MAG: M3 family oligoendopeptidase [Halanaerobiaceae bacterium]
MNKDWNLDNLYPGFDSEKFKQEKEEFISILEKIKQWQPEEEKKPLVLAEEFIENLRECYHLYYKLIAFSRLTVSVDAENETALKSEEKLEKKITELTRPRVRFQLWLSELPERKNLYQESSLLEEHRFFLEELVEESEFLLSEEQEELVAQMKQTGSSAWNKLHQKLTSTLMVSLEIEGEKQKKPLSFVRNLAHRKDPEVRKNAYQAELKAYEKIDKSAAAALNAIKGEVLTVIKKRGYESPLDKTLRDSRMEHKTLEVMMDVIKDYLPEFRKYYRKKAELMGHEDGLPFYDIFAPVGEIDLEFSYEKAAEFIISNINPLSPRMAEFYDTAFNQSWIDAEPKSGKRGGAFCYNIQPIKESRIMANFSGSFSDMLTLAHELGHAYHGHCLKEESILNTNYPMPLAETASIFSETAVNEAALKEAAPEEKITILENSLSQAGQIIVDIYSRFVFEKNLFQKRKQASLSVEELNSLMLEAQKQAYGDALDENSLHPYMWLNKSHYYSAGNNYYNFPYAFGFLFALGVFALRKKEGSEFMENYRSLLRATGKNRVKDVAQKAGIDLQSREFWENSLQIVKQDINKFTAMAD